MRLRNARTGVVINVDDRTAATLGGDWRPADTVGGYAAMKVADLRGEVERRNEARSGDALIPTDGKKADLVAALQADDEAGGER